MTPVFKTRDYPKVILQLRLGTTPWEKLFIRSKPFGFPKRLRSNKIGLQVVINRIELENRPAKPWLRRDISYHEKIRDDSCFHPKAYYELSRVFIELEETE
jgi:hypothetical protein